jgi:hypothetical protein
MSYVEQEDMTRIADALERVALNLSSIDDRLCSIQRSAEDLSMRDNMGDIFDALQKDLSYIASNIAPRS